MEYESFKPVDKSEEKNKRNIFQRFKKKFNGQTINEVNDAKEEIVVVPQKSVPNKTSVVDATKNSDIKAIQSSRDSNSSYISKRHPADFVQEKMTISWILKTVTSNFSSNIRESSDNMATEKVDREFWMPDSICRKCYSCEKEFTTIKRKHHCRMCGQIFCYRCCSDELPGSLWNLTKSQRSCKRCFLTYYSQNGPRKTSIRDIRSRKVSNISHRSSKYNISPRGSITSENITTEESNLVSSKKNLSFSSNDVSFILDSPVKDFESETDEETEILSESKRNNVSEIEEVQYDPKFQNVERKKSLNIHVKNFLPSNILSKDKIFGTSHLSSKISSNNNFQRDLLTVWRLIINETEKYRKYYFTKIRLQNQTRIMEEQFSFPMEDEDAESSSLPIHITDIHSLKSCIHGNNLLDWIVKHSEVTDVYQATIMCQSYLEMQLLYPYFPEKENKFKCDSTLYVIREFTAEFSPLTNYGNFFNESGQFGNLCSQSFGNSIFYLDNDSSNSRHLSNKDEESQIRSPKLIRTDVKSNDGDNDDILSESISQKNNTNLWNRSCKYLEKLTKQELHDYNLDISWCNIILPICKFVSETITPINIMEKSINDIRQFVQIKKIPDSSKNECKVVESVSMSKNIDYPMKTDIRNPSVMLIRSSLDYWRHKKLVSFDPLLLQEDEYLKKMVQKIQSLRPDIVVVEGSVSLIAKEYMENYRIILISNVRKEQMERLSRMLGAVIFDSVDSIGTNVQSALGKCSQFSVQNYTLTNGRKKTLLFFKLVNPKHGCTFLLHGKSLSELVRVKYVTKFIIVAFKNAYLELAFMKNFQIRSLPSNQHSRTEESTLVGKDLTSPFIDIINNRHIAMSVNVHYKCPDAVLRSISNPDLQNQLLSLDIINFSWKEKLHDVMKRKQRHICAELYDVVRMNTCKHPLIFEPALHAFTNSFADEKLNNRDRCILYSDFREKGSRFYLENDDLENSMISTLNFATSDLACRVGFLTKSQEIKWRNMEKKKFESITDTFNPRNYQRILLLYSIQTSQGICEKPRKISLNYYESTDRTLGNFVTSMLNDVTSCPIKCEIPIFEHVYKFVSNGGCVQVSLHFMKSEPVNRATEFLPDSDNTSKVKLWNWCSRCDKQPSLQSMTNETWNLSLGRFFDLLFNLNCSDVSLFPPHCFHSLQTDIHYYFTLGSVNKALEFKYIPIKMFEFRSPSLFIPFKQSHRSEESLLSAFRNLQTEVNNVVEVKNKYNLRIKEKLLELKAISKEKENELCDFLTQESNSTQYTQKMQNIFNLLDEIYCSTSGKFNVELFENNENYIKDEIIDCWSDIDSEVAQWDEKINEAFEQEKADKRLSKTETKNLKNSNDNLLIDNDGLLIKSYKFPKTDKNTLLPDSKDNDEKHFYITNSNDQICDDVNSLKNASLALEIPCQSYPLSRTSTEISFENIDDLEISLLKKEKLNQSREIELKQTKSGEKMSLSANSMQPLKKLFPGLYNAPSYKVFEDPTSLTDSFSFLNVKAVRKPVVVKDDFMTSVVAFALSSDVYLEMLNEYSKQSNTVNNEKLETIPQSSKQNPKSTEDLTETVNISNSIYILNNEKRNTFKSESGTKEREISVRYIHHSEDGEQLDLNDNDNQYYVSKSDTEDIKIEVSAEENLNDEVNSKSVVDGKVASKSLTNSDLIINLNNHKIKCQCKVYFAKQFHDLRQKVFQNDDLHYIRSLSECKSWITTGGKSGLKFRKTLDNRFIIKQLQTVELEGFKKFHKKYFDYISEKVAKKEKCILAKILGVYQVDYNNSLTKFTDKMEFLVMENVFYNQSPSRIFDLKGNKIGAVNLSAEKISMSDNSVMQDKDFINYCRSNPLYVSWQAQVALKEILTRDTEFLQSLPVMDYSLLVGVDNENNILIVGIIDYLRMFTMDKLIEMHIKQKLMTPHGELPTVIQPQRYQKRFLEAMEEYFLVCPVPWDYMLLYPSNSYTNSIKKQNYSFNFSSIFPSKPQKILTTPNCGKTSDENKLRLGIVDV